MKDDLDAARGIFWWVILPSVVLYASLAAWLLW